MLPYWLLWIVLNLSPKLEMVSSTWHMDAHLQTYTKSDACCNTLWYTCICIVIFAFKNDAFQVVHEMRVPGDRTSEWPEKIEVLRRNKTGRMTQWGSIPTSSELGSLCGSSAVFTESYPLFICVNATVVDDYLCTSIQIHTLVRGIYMGFQEWYCLSKGLFGTI